MTNVQPAPATSDLYLTISEDAWRGDAQYTVSVDGVQQGGVRTATALLSADAMQQVLIGAFAAGPHVVSVTFLNDAWGGTSATDRNLYVDALAFGSNVFAGAALYADGTSAFAVDDTVPTDSRSVPPASLSSTPIAPPITLPPVTPPTATSALTLSISEDAWLGDAHYTVSVDGVEQGGVRTATASHALGADEQVLIGSFAAGPHAVAITFLNDAWGGTAATDRNLYVDGVTFGGVTVAGAALYTDETSTITVGAPVRTTPAQDTLTLQLSEQAASGDVAYSITVNGVVYGGVRTESSPASSPETITIDGQFGVAPEIVITLLNAAQFGGTSGTRKLFVTGGTYDGNAILPATLTTDTSSVLAPSAAAAAAPPDTLILELSEDSYLGDAQFTVSIDGRAVGGVMTATAERSSGNTQPFLFTGHFGSGPHTVVVTFLNDAYGGNPSLDRNLYIDNVVFDGQVFDGASEFGTGPTSFAVSSTTGYGPGNPSSIAGETNGSGPDQLALKISEDAYDGNAQYTISVNGAEVGGVRTATAIHGLGQDQTVTLNGSWGQTPPTVTVTFLNDKYDGLPKLDRNLYVDSISYKTTSYPGAEIASNGSFNFTPTGASASGGSPPASGGGSNPTPSPAPATGTIDYAPAVPQPSSPGDVVGLDLQNTQSGAVSARLITFGQEFAAGQVPAGSQLVAIIDGQRVAVQMDVKATNADGSVRMADLTFQQPLLAANSTTGVMLALAPAPAASPAVDLSSLAAHGYNVTVDIGIHNSDGSVTPYHIDAGAALSKALAAGTVSYWLQGSQVTEARVDVPISGMLHVTLDIRAYADGSTQTDVQFNNDAEQAGVTNGDVTYAATIKQNGTTVLQQNAIKQYQYQTWDQQVYSNGAPGVNVQHDVAALERTGAIQNYDLTAGVADSLIQSNFAQLTDGNFGILGNGDHAMMMGTTGERPDIGPTTDQNTIWLVTQNQQAATYALAQDAAAGSIPWHYYNPTTGTYSTTTNNPTLWTDPRGGPSTYTTALPAGVNFNSGWQIDTSHQPNLTYDAYLMTGSRYDLNQLDAQAAANVTIDWPAIRLNGQDILLNGNDQVRGEAWALQQVDNAAFIDPNSDVLKSYFQQIENNNFAYVLGQIPALTASEGQLAGYLPGYYGTPGNLAPWQQDFVAMIVGQAAQQGNAAASQFLAWQTNFLAGRYLAPGFDPNNGDAYNLQVANAQGQLLTTWAQVQQATVAAGNYLGTPFATYMESARSSLSEAITNNMSPQAIGAFGWVSKYYTLDNLQAFQLSPKYEVAPRLSDGQLLTQNNIHISTDTIASTLKYGNADQLVYAGSGNDTVVGGTGINMLFAGSGTDTLFGGPGSDYLFGGTGASTLSGGAGANYMQAGTGATTFLLTETDVAQDTIVGFRPGTDSLQVFASPGAHMTGASLASLIGGATQDAAGDAVLHLSASHTVTLAGISMTQLSAAGVFS